MYTTLSAALNRAKERSGATTADDAYLTELLTLSAGKAPDGVTHFRPFIAAARWLEQNRSIHSIKSADGATFTGQATPIASLIAQQASIDNAFSLTVPDGWEAVTTAAASSNPVPRFSTRSTHSQIRP